MNYEISNESFVVVGKNLMPSLFNQLWLTENSVMTKDDLSQNKDKQIFSPQLVNISTDFFEFLVMPQRLQIMLKNEDVELKKTIVEKVVLTTVKSLSNIEYLATGSNITYVFDFSPESSFEYKEKCRKFFVCSQNAVVDKHFLTPDSKFGFYCSKDFKGMRLKLDVKPLKTDETADSDKLALSFNFHCDIKTNEIDAKKELVLKNIKNWSKAMDESNKIVKDFIEMWES